MNTHKRLVTYMSDKPSSRRSQSPTTYMTRAQIKFLARPNRAGYQFYKFESYNKHCTKCLISHCCGRCCQNEHPYYNTSGNGNMKGNFQNSEMEKPSYSNQYSQNPYYNTPNPNSVHQMPNTDSTQQNYLEYRQQIEELEQIKQSLTADLQGSVYDYKNLLKQKQQQDYYIAELKQINSKLEGQNLYLKKTVDQIQSEQNRKSDDLRMLEQEYERKIQSMNLQYIQLERELNFSKQQLKNTEFRMAQEQQQTVKRTQEIKGKLKIEADKQLSIKLSGTSNSGQGTSSQAKAREESIAKMQDSLCEKINKNILLEETLLRKIQQLDQKLQDAHQLMELIDRQENKISLEFDNIISHIDTVKESFTEACRDIQSNII